MANVDWGQIQKALGGEKAFENVSGLAGAFLTSKGQGDRADRNTATNNAQFKARMNQDSSQFAATLAQRLEESRRNNDLNRAGAAMGATKLGENENFATRNRLLSALIPQMRNSNLRPTDAAVAGTMGPQGGFLPPGGLPPELLAAISERGTASAIGNRSKQLLNIDSRAAMPDFAAMGFTPEHSDMGLEQYRTQIQGEENAARSSSNENIQRALMQDYEGIMALPDTDPQKAAKKDGFWKKFAKIAAIAAPIVAAPFTGGLSLAAIGAGSGGALAALNGGGAGSILGGAALGGASGYGAKRLPTGGAKPPGWGVLK